MQRRTRLSEATRTSRLPKSHVASKGAVGLEENRREELYLEDGSGIDEAVSNVGAALIQTF
jgi:hypothetical protein